MPKERILVVDDEEDILELGADDYITKPFSPRVLIARIRTALRRKVDKAEDDTAVVSLWISRRITRPIEAMNKSAGHFADGDFSRRLEAPDSEEMAGLADALNQMAAQLDLRINSIVSRRNELETVCGQCLA